jgi:hypothetical protein
MSGERDEVESEIVLPGGMELVVPPPARDEDEPRERSSARREAARGGHPRPAHLPPSLHRGELRRTPAA